ncbi:cilia- and flagella-associated protein 45 [Strongylocentrotus purpuratus]|uniref:Cilia- and flagella-associated protein 45 n=1 Tax=Strongylocentrotus purpuratus TaxID=7668 RepID=A0A7M7NFL8_STRPU|nr:cilia- and flagella-associated protein 45 [Strongylocentrotus purpuratus]8SNB_3W Chain 3W, Cilia- and flagella-associated protein 45 [Strongylocentrotus purpuratus]8SNB_3X Chain 3X, Cilia- and flagella-associated protein 45 [Strongylocentrotus purpuratus]8SNB_3Y Chain 3Y, Cilia- and flagella-associated protein 45 [Strongylocentrotus purpuratus]8SNB_3Z Chain 3Z, Cilia- and flagella-associated protein 45 [Strongylocentrotus purpuratus]
MPHSVISDSSTSSASRRAKTRQYYTVSKTSQVDESLFGSNNKNGSNKNTQPTENTEPRRASGGRNKKKQKEEVQVITKDLIRKLVVAQEDPSGQSVVLPFDEYRRIMGAARTMSHEEKVADFKRRQADKQKQQDASNEIKLHMQALDRKRQKNEKLTDLEEEAKEQGEYLLAKAREQQEEQEDEIKHLNELMLNAKCHAIRDAQILEKGIIKEETTDEEKRLDAMMEVERQRALLLQEEIEEQRKVERYEGKSMILTQISQREEERLLQQEKKDQEAQQMLKYLGKLQVEDLKDLDRKRQIQLEAQKEIARSNEESEELKKKKQEQEKLADLKVNEYTKQKAEREAAFEAEQERIRIEKEKEIARLRAMQERAKDYQAEKDALRAKRNQEQREREWRQKEKEEVIIKAETEFMLKEAREVQVQNKEHFLAVQAQRERAEFERVLRAQQEAMNKDRAEEEETKYNRLTHADDVRKQIREKEQIRVSDRNAFFEEGVKINDEARDRRAKLDAIKKKKLGELRDAGVPDKYCAEVERKTMAVKH